MKKIIFLLPSLSGGGAERQAVTIACLLKRKGYSVDFLCYSSGDFYKEILKKEGIQIYNKECNYLRRIMYVCLFLMTKKPDVVISFMPTPNFLNCFSALFSKKRKVIISERSSKESDLRSRKGRFYAMFFRRANVIVCNSNNAVELWTRYYPRYQSKLTTIYNTVVFDTNKFDYLPKDGGIVNILVAGSVYKIKNPMGLIEAIKLMTLEERTRFHVDWYGKKEVEGDCSEYDKVIKEIEDNSLGDTITMHDATKEIAKYMAKADCVALFSKLEGLPNVICEAMVLGKPIIMTCVSDYNVLVEDNTNGYLCLWDNPSSIKEAILKIAACSIDKLYSMGEESNKKADVLFGKERILNQWIQQIEK